MKTESDYQRQIDQAYARYYDETWEFRAKGLPDEERSKLELAAWDRLEDAVTDIWRAFH